MGDDGLLAPDSIQSLVGAGLHIDPFRRDPDSRREGVANGLDVREEAGNLGDDDRVEIGDFPAFRPDEAGPDVLKEGEAPNPRVARVGIRIVATDIPQPGCAQK